MTIITTFNKTFLHALCESYDYDGSNESVINLYKFIIVAFLNAGISINAKDENGYTAYDHVRYNHNLIGEFLEQNGAL